MQMQAVVGVRGKLVARENIETLARKRKKRMTMKASKTPMIKKDNIKLSRINHLI